MQETEKSNLEPDILTPEMHASKKRRVCDKVVVTVKIEGNEKRQQRSECPPSDCWSWRKYGQKPIKGSPFPRGYYRCSTSKGCSAKKQVERSRTDASMLIITYTSTHNHPGPNSTNQEKETEQINHIINNSQPTTPKQEQESLISTTPNGEGRFEYSQSPFDSTPDHIIGENPFQENLETSIYGQDRPEPCCSDNMKLSSSSVVVVKAEENDFYDELEELPTTSFFTAFMKNSFCGERSVVNSS